MAETKDNVYVENEDFTPDPTDLRGTFNTTRTGVPHNPDAASEVFVQDRYAAAQSAKRALDGEGGELLYTESDTSVEAEQERVRKVVERRLADGEPVPGAPTEAEQEAAQETSVSQEGATSHSEQPDISAVLTTNHNAQGIAEKSVEPKDADKRAEDTKAASKSTAKSTTTSRKATS